MSSSLPTTTSQDDICLPFTKTLPLPIHYTNTTGQALLLYCGNKYDSIEHPKTKKKLGVLKLACKVGDSVHLRPNRDTKRWTVEHEKRGKKPPSLLS